MTDTPALSQMWPTDWVWHSVSFVCVIYMTWLFGYMIISYMLLYFLVISVSVCVGVKRVGTDDVGGFKTDKQKQIHTLTKYSQAHKSSQFRKIAISWMHIQQECVLSSVHFTKHFITGVLNLPKREHMKMSKEKGKDVMCCKNFEVSLISGFMFYYLKKCFNKDESVAHIWDSSSYYNECKKLTGSWNKSSFFSLSVLFTTLWSKKHKLFGK